jgi:hypothetical protein
MFTLGLSVLSMRELVSNSFSSPSVTRRDSERALPHSPEPFSALKIGQSTAFDHRQVEDLRDARSLVTLAGR